MQEPFPQETPQDDPALVLTMDRQQLLLSLARNSIAHYLEHAVVPPFSSDDPALLRLAGVFTTLRLRSGDPSLAYDHLPLRGCMGHIKADTPLARTVQFTAARAAGHDPRFEPLPLEDLPKVAIKLSVLSPLYPVNAPHEVTIGKHGLFVIRGSYQGLLLPEVAPRLGWGFEEWIANLCQKAGLPPDAWPGDAHLFRFETIDFGEMA